MGSEMCIRDRVDHFIEAVGQIATGRIRATYEQAADGTFAPAGGWPRMTGTLSALLQSHHGS